MRSPQVEPAPPEPIAAPEPVHTPSGRRTPGVIGALGHTLTLAGVVALAAVAFQLVFSALLEANTQRDLRGELSQTLKTGFADGARPAAHIPSGTAVALITIPRIGVERVVVEGSGARETRRGPGHLRTSVLPGQRGNAVIAGRRTTYGAPLRDLGSLRTGDRIYATTPFGRFEYRVVAVDELVPGQPDQLGASEASLLTLVTSHPAYHADARLVVTAQLQGEPSTYRDPARPQTVADEETLTGGRPRAVVAALLLAQLLIAAFVGTVVLYRRWVRWPAYLVSTPVLLALMIAWLEAVVAMLPPTL